MGRSKHIKHCSWHIIACELKCRAKSGRGPQGFWADADTKETINWKPMYSNPIPPKNSKITNSQQPWQESRRWNHILETREWGCLRGESRQISSDSSAKSFHEKLSFGIWNICNLHILKLEFLHISKIHIILHVSTYLQKVKCCGCCHRRTRWRKTTVFCCRTVRPISGAPPCSWAIKRGHGSCCEALGSISIIVCYCLFTIICIHTYVYIYIIHKLYTCVCMCVCKCVLCRCFWCWCILVWTLLPHQYHVCRILGSARCNAPISLTAQRQNQSELLSVPACREMPWVRESGLLVYWIRNSEIDLRNVHQYNLVGWFWTFGWFFHSVGNFIIPTDQLHYFSEGEVNHQPVMSPCPNTYTYYLGPRVSTWVCRWLMHAPQNYRLQHHLQCSSNVFVDWTVWDSDVSTTIRYSGHYSSNFNGFNLYHLVNYNKAIEAMAI